MKGRLSYIIPMHNSENTIKDTLDSLLKNENIFEVVLVDDCSTDGTEGVVSGYAEKYPNIKYLKNAFRRGAGLSRNRGARIARGDILVFLDADVVVPGNIPSLIEEYFFDRKVGENLDVIVAGREKNALEKGIISMYKNYWTSYNLSKINGWTSFLCSSFFAIKKDVFFDVHGFQDIPHAEDNDLGYRLSAKGYKIYLANNIRVSHKKKFSVSSLLKREFKAGRESIKLKLKNRVLGDIVRKKKFFAVNKNFIYSFPLAILFTLCLALSATFQAVEFLYGASLIFLLIAAMNREFLAFASCKNDLPRSIPKAAGLKPGDEGKVWGAERKAPLTSKMSRGIERGLQKGLIYVSLMIAQFNAICLGLLTGLADMILLRARRILKTLLHYGRSLIKLFIKNLGGPEQITFFVTERCNLNCSHCFVNSKLNNHELSVTEIEKFTKKIGRVGFVTITGGEPFLREDIGCIAGILNRNLKPYMMTILTNGYKSFDVIDKINEILQNCKDVNILVKLSIDGPAEIHDEMRLRKGAYQNTYRTYEMLKGLKRTYKNLSVGIITTYTEKNQFALDGFLETVVRSLKPDQYGLVLERPAESNKLNTAVDLDHYIWTLKKINKKMLEETHGFFRRFRLAYKNIMADKLKEIYKTGKYPMKCYAGVLNTVIFSNGDIFACEQLKILLGNIREKDYMWNDIWNSDKAKKVRKAIREKICFCTNECYMPFNLSYNIKELLGVLRGLV